MNTAIATRSGGYQGLGFAIPAGMLNKIIPQLIERGKVARGYVGVEIRDDPRLLKTYGVDHGVVVEGVVDDSPAQAAGLKRGDVILEVDGQKMRDSAHLRGTVADLGPETSITLQILRDGRRLTVPLTLAELPADLAMGEAAEDVVPDESDPVEAQVLRKLGLERVRTMTESLAESLGADYSPGVLVERVRRGSVAATEGINRGTLITSVQGETVEDVQALIKALGERDLTQAVRLTVAEWADGRWRQRFAVVQLDHD
jgi:serine protease Do